MHPELEKLLKITLTDGYLSDKERQVLKRKAESLGTSADEMDIIIDATLFEQNKKNPPKKDKNKCPACGETVQYFQQNCPSCGGELDKNRNKSEKKANPEDESDVSDAEIYLYSARQTVTALEGEKLTGISQNAAFWFCSIYTLGLYALAKKMIVGGAILDDNARMNDTYICVSDFYKNMYLHETQNKGNQALLQSIIERRDDRIRKNRRFILFIPVLLFSIFIAILVLGVSAGSPAMRGTSLSQENNVHFNDYSNPDKETQMKATLTTLDSLQKAGNVRATFKIINSQAKREDLEWLVEREIAALVEQNKFAEAKTFLDSVKYENISINPAYAMVRMGETIHKYDSENAKDTLDTIKPAK